MANLEHAGVVITLPGGWTKHSATAAFGPAAGAFRPSVSVTSDPWPANTPQDVPRHIAALKSELGGFKLLGQGPMRFSAFEGIVVEFECKHQKAETYQIQLYFLHKGRSYAVTFAHGKPLAKAARTLALKMFGEMKPKAD